MTDTRPQDLPHPGASSLHDFEPLLAAESLILRAAAHGDIAKVGYRRPRAPGAEARVRASFLAFLARGGSAAAPVAGRHLQIMGACVTGRLDLAGATLPMSLWLYRCTFVATPLLDGARVLGSLSFADSALPALQAEGCRVDGDLALSAGCSIDGEIRLARSAVGGDLNCERLQLRGGSDPARSLRRMFVADGMRIGGDVNLQGGVEAVGELRFVGAQIDGDLRASGAHLTADIDAAGTRGVALNLDRARIGGSVRLDAGFSAAGTVRMQQAGIGGDLDCGGAAFDTIGDANWGECGSSLRLDRARIGGALILRGLQEPLQGASLADARVGTLTDDAGSWGQDHVLDGFAWTRFGAGAPTDAPARVDWLVRQAAAHVDLDFRPDPWQRAIGALHRTGHGVSASALAIGRERHLRRIGRIGLGTPLALRWLTRLGHDAWGLFAGYGHRPWRLPAAGALLWLLCGGAYWAAADRGGFTAAAWAASEPRFAACGTDCARLPAGVPAFQPLVYSLDALLPLADLRQERHWAPARHALMPEAEPWVGVPLLQLLIWFEAACGWALALMALTSLFGRRGRGHEY
ncbi:MAG: hypothetical protein ACSLE9_16365 [Burkholderiaceae bacterium]